MKGTRSSNGSGSLFHSAGRWRAKYHHDGVRRTVTFPPEITTKSKARKALNELLVDVGRGVHKEPSRILLSDFAVAWLAEHVARHGLKRTTASFYKTVVTRHLIPGLGRSKLAEITTADVKAYTAKVIERGLGARSANAHVQVLGMILSGAIDAGIIDRNPVTRSCRLRQTRAKVEILTSEQARAIEIGYDVLIEEATDEARRDDLRVSRLAYLLAWGLGLRRGEIQGARWRHIDFQAEKPSISIEETWTAHHEDVPKSEASVRVLQLPGKLVHELRKHLMASHYKGGDERILPNARTGRPLDSHVHYALFREACAQAEVEPPKRALHDLRHAFATHAAASTDNAFSVQRRMGHSSMATTMIYVNLARETFSDDVAALEERQFGPIATGEAAPYAVPHGAQPAATAPN